MLIFAAPLVTLIGLFFGGFGLNSKGKWRALSVIAVIVCFLALILSILIYVRYVIPLLMMKPY